MEENLIILPELILSLDQTTIKLVPTIYEWTIAGEGSTSTSTTKREITRLLVFQWKDNS